MWIARTKQAGLAVVGGAVFWGLAALNAALVTASAVALAARGWLGGH